MNKSNLVPIGNHAYITKLAGYEYTKHFDYSVGGKIIALRSLNIKNGKIDLSETHTIPRSVSDALPRSKLAKGDIVLGYIGSKLGNLAVIDEDDKYHLAPNVAVIRANAETDPAYLFHYMRGKFYQHQLWSYASSTGQPALSMGNIRKTKIYFPKLVEQTKIAKTLNAWDQAIEATEKLIENSERQKKALMQQLLTGKKHLKGFSGGWIEVKLGEVAKIKKGKALSKRHLTEGDYPVIAGGKSSPYSHGEFTHENIITVSASGAYAGYVAYHPRKIWASDCSVVEGKEKIRTKYAFELLRLNQRQIYRLQSGGAQPHIYPVDIEGIKIFLPPIDEQDAILSVLENSRETVRRYKSIKDRLTREKAALMQQLLTGKRRVKVDGEVQDAKLAS